MKEAEAAENILIVVCLLGWCLIVYRLLLWAWDYLS